MTWLTHLSFVQALRWAALWPALLLTAVALTVGLAALLHWRGDWAFAFGVTSASRLPVWLAVILSTCAVLFAPSLAFLALWKTVRR